MALPSRAVGLTLAGLTGIVLALAVGPRLVHAGEVLPGVHVNGVDVGGQSREDARATLQAALGELSSTPIVLAFEDDELEVLPASFDWEVDVDQATERAYAVGRDGGLLADTLDQLTARFGDELLDIRPRWDDDALDRVVADVAARFDVDPGSGALEADPATLRVEAVAPPRGIAVRAEVARELLLEAAEARGDRRVEVPVEVTAPPVTLEQVEAAAERAEAAIASPIRLFHDQVEVVLEPATLARLVTLRLQDDEVLLAADPMGVEAEFADVVDALEQPAVDARFLVDRAPSTTLDAKDAVTWEPRPAQLGIEPSVPGATFDAELVAAQLGDLFESGTREARIALREVEAEYTTEDLRALDVDQLLGTFTTYHSCCQARVHNIQTLADMVDGTIVEPGEQFSINQISGERTCAKGFRPAGMILNGEIVDSCGGGVSQFGTTAFNAAFFAGLQLDAWKAHSFYISRYPMGREATLNFPSPDIDVRFTNDTGNGLYIRTAYTPTSITVSIYGNSDVTRVEATRSGTFNPRGYTTQRRPNPALAPGQQVRVQAGAGGFTVRVNRFIHRGDDVEDQEIVTVYQPVREIIEYGPGQPAPQPTPSPRPTSSPGPSPSPSSSPSSSPSGQPSPDPEPSPSPSPSPSPEPTGGGGGDA